MKNCIMENRDGGRPAIETNTAGLLRTPGRYMTIRDDQLARRQRRWSVSRLRTTVAASAVLILSALSLLAQRPSNDNFANARNLGSVASFDVTSSTVGATREAGEPLTSYGTVWFRWVAPRTGVATFEAMGRTGDNRSIAPHIRIGQGTRVANLPLAGESHQPSGGALSRLRLPVQAGQQYRIQLSGALWDTRTVRLRLSALAPITDASFGVKFGEPNYFYAAPRTNDNFATARLIATRNAAGALVYPARFSATASTVGATRETGEPWTSYGTVWFRWVAPVTGVATFEAVGRLQDDRSVAPHIRIGQGARVAALSVRGESHHPSGSGLSRLRLPVRAGQQYHIQVSGALGNTQTATLNLVGITLN